MTDQTNVEPKLTHEEFILHALRTESLYHEGCDMIHTVWSGFNSAFRTYYGRGADPIVATRALAKSGKIRLCLSKGGARMRLPINGDGGDFTDRASRKSPGKNALDDMGL